MVLQKMLGSFVLASRCALLVLVFVLLGCESGTESQPAEEKAVSMREVDLSEYFHGINPEDATFVLLDNKSGEITRFNPDRARTQFIPASTYKIPNSLIALETGVASGADHAIAFDSTRHHHAGYWARVWSNDHTLKTAIRNSVYWFYQELAREVGAERMQHYVDHFDA